MYSVNLKKDCATRGASACAARANLPFDGSLVLKSIKRSVINIDSFVKSLKITILPILHPINSTSYKVDLGKF